jgi:hypothetical protein
MLAQVFLRENVVFVTICVNFEVVNGTGKEKTKINDFFVQMHPQTLNK